MYQSKTQSVLESAIFKVGSFLEARIEGEQLNASICVIDIFTPMPLERYKAKSLTGGSYVKLPNINQTKINIKNVGKLCALWSILGIVFSTQRNPSSTAT